MQSVEPNTDSTAAGWADVVLHKDKPASPAKRAIYGVMSVVATAVLLIWIFPWVLQVSWGEIFSTLGAIQPLALVIALGIALAISALIAVQTWAGFKGLKLKDAYLIQTFFNGLKVVIPFGAAAALAAVYPLFRRRGLSRGRIALGVVLTSIVPTAIEFLLPLIGLLALALASSREISTTWLSLIWGIIAVGFLVFVTIFTIVSSEKRTRALAEAIQKALRLIQNMGGENVAAFTETIPEHVLAARSEILGSFKEKLTLFLISPLLVTVLQFGLLLICVWATGLELSTLELFAAFAIGTTVALVPLTPGGVGLRETGMAALFVFFGAPAAAIGASLTIYALFTTGVDILLGVISAGLLNVSAASVSKAAKDGAAE